MGLFFEVYWILGWASWTCVGRALFSARRAWDGESLRPEPASSPGPIPESPGIVARKPWFSGDFSATGCDANQRSGRDLNPRYGDTVYGISSAASSAARAPLRIPTSTRDRTERFIVCSQPQIVSTSPTSVSFPRGPSTRPSRSTPTPPALGNSYRQHQLSPCQSFSRLLSPSPAAGPRRSPRR
jgi:hypothetical protein